MRITLIKNICRIGAVAGLVGTAYFSVKKGEEIRRRFDVVKLESTAMDKKHTAYHYIKKVPYLAKPLIPTLVCAAGSVTCMAISEKISYRQVAALTATCIYLTKNRDFLEKKLEEVVGKERLADIKKEFVKKEAEGIANFPCVEETGFGDLLCLEGYSGRWFRSSKEKCIEAQEMLQKQFDEDIYCCLNDYYGYLGITMTQFGHELGWVNDSDWMGPKIGFSNMLLTPEEWDDKGPDLQPMKEPVFVLEIDQMPMYSWQEV